MVTETWLPYLTFSIGEQYYALSIDYLVEVAAMVELTRTPDMNAQFIGIANRHGTVLPLLDLRAVFQQDAPAMDVATLFIVGRVGERMVGLVVDTIDQMEYIAANELSASQSKDAFIEQIITRDSRLIQVVALPAVMAACLPQDMKVESEQ